VIALPPRSFRRRGLSALYNDMVTHKEKPQSGQVRSSNLHRQNAAFSVSSSTTFGYSSHWCTVSQIMVASPAVSWLFFKARAKRPYLIHTGRASNAEKQPTGHGPAGCVGNGPAAALLVGYVSIEICALLAPCRRPILNATTSPLFARRCTSRFLCGRVSSTSLGSSTFARQRHRYT
jgi:hypothetical protein